MTLRRNVGREAAPRHAEASREAEVFARAFDCDPP
jgi:hypothetical protein